MKKLAQSQPDDDDDAGFLLRASASQFWIKIQIAWNACEEHRFPGAITEPSWAGPRNLHVHNVSGRTSCGQLGVRESGYGDILKSVEPGNDECVILVGLGKVGEELVDS